MRSFGSISLISTTLSAIVVMNAYLQKKQFYPSVVYITKSNPSMAVVFIQAFVLVWLAGKIMRKIFFGQLRQAEMEHLVERSWYALTETCLAFTVFRDDFNLKFVALFTLLLFLKSFHWLAEDRVDYLEQSPSISLLFYVRLQFLILLLGELDIFFIKLAYYSTATKGASVQMVFGFEYAILLTILINMALKFALHCFDVIRGTPWDNRSVFLLYTELVIGFIKVILYGSFVTIMVRIYTVPLFALRPMYYSLRNFKKAFSDLILSRRAIHNMNTLYPDATSEELQAADNVCIICREEMTSASKKLPCHHIFHTACLRSWFQRQQTCPTCRLNILQTRANHPPRRHPFANRMFLGHNIFPVPDPNGGAQQQADPPAGHETPQQPQQIPQFVLPPFPFLPFLPPPPMPPQNFGALTDEQLRRMEGTERENVEARIQCLRNIQTLLDGAVTMMEQYSTMAILSTINTPSPPPNLFPNGNPSVWNLPSQSDQAPPVAKVAPTTTASQQVTSTSDSLTTSLLKPEEEGSNSDVSLEGLDTSQKDSGVSQSSPGVSQENSGVSQSSSGVGLESLYLNQKSSEVSQESLEMSQ
ncbi:hypothetical protein JTB14_014862 [Gonioctena quinquepunctata]|nr:hypothetical protein JTB14_014862 [Gonioctena quinquepunctata]